MFVGLADDRVTIAPGDHVYADREGALIVPRGSVDAILDEALQIEEEDEAYKEQVQRETRPSLDD